MNGRGPWEKIILSDHGNPLMGSLRSSSVSPKYGLQRLNLWQIPPPPVSVPNADPWDQIVPIDGTN